MALAPSTPPESREYKSPRHKLIAFFHQSRDAWKAKYKASKKRSRRLLRYLEKTRASRDGWHHKATLERLARQELQSQITRLERERVEAEQLVQQVQREVTQAREELLQRTTEIQQLHQRVKILQHEQMEKKRWRPEFRGGSVRCRDTAPLPATSRTPSL
jgi:hypothetical protein